MTRSRVEFPVNCSSGIPLFFAGLIAVGAGLRHSSTLCIALGVSLVAVTTGVFLLLRLSLQSVRVWRSFPPSAFEGDTIEVQVFLRNGSRLPLFYPRTGEVFSPEVHAQKTVVFPVRVLHGETVSETYRADCILPRGIYPIGPTWISLSDPLGWFQLRKKVSSRAWIKVYPRFQPFGMSERLGVTLSMILNDMTRYGIGDSNEFFSVREYRPGDPLRRVHWTLTAHRGFPVVRENTRTSVGDLCIILDLCRLARLGFGRSSNLEQAVKIAAALSSHALNRGHRVQLLARGERDFRVPPAKGRGQLGAILDLLVEVKADGRDPLSDLLDGWSQRVIPGSTVVLMVSPYLYSSKRFERQIVGLHRRGARVVLVVFDGSTYQNLYEVPELTGSGREYAVRARSLGMSTYVVPCAADLPVLFTRPEGAPLPAAGGAS